MAPFREAERFWWLCPRQLGGRQKGRWSWLSGCGCPSRRGRIYKATAPNRLDDFTMTKLKARIRQERNNTRFEGVVSSDGSVLKGARIELKPLAGGRRRVATSKATGVFEITSMEAGDYSVSVSASGKTTITKDISIVTNVPLQMDFELV